MVFPLFPYLDAVAALVAGSAVGLGGQNCYHESQGAFTGEVSPLMLKDLGCAWVILGHSERRHVLGETDAAICRKVQAVLAAGLTPIVCVGELLAERQAERTQAVIAGQFAGSLGDLDASQLDRVVLAYEPVWAIGTGQVATPAQAQEVHADLRKLLVGRYNSLGAEGNARAARIRLLYGGSVKPDNAAELLTQTDVDGALVGGASLKVADFLGIAQG